MSDHTFSEWDAYKAEVLAASLSREVEYIRQYAQHWTSVGGGKYKCLSPLRPDRSAGSFIVYDNGRGWHDYSTSEGGDLLSFARKKHGLNLRQAVDEVAKFCGIQPWDERVKKYAGPKVSDEDLLKMWRQESTSHDVFEALSALIYVCHWYLPDQIRSHLNDHCGFSDDFIDMEKIGYCPPSLWEMRYDFLPQFPDETLLATGFFHKRGAANQRGVTVSPLMSMRIVFPYWKDGLCRYAIGRKHIFKGFTEEQVNVKDHDKPKYKKLYTHHAETRPYVDPCIQNIIWGEDSLRGKSGGTILITEGVTDAAMLRQLDYPVISPVTVQLREDDYERAVKILASAKDVVIINDEETKTDAKTGDVRHPGLEGAKRMAERLTAAKIPIRIGRLAKPDGVEKTDVNEVGRDALLRGGEEEAKRVFGEVIRGALSYLDFQIQELAADLPAKEVTLSLTHMGALCIDFDDLMFEGLVQKIVTKFGKRFPKKLIKDQLHSARLEARNARRFREREAAATSSVASAAPVGQPQSQTNGATVTNPGPSKINQRLGTSKIAVTIIEDIGLYERMDANGSCIRISNFSLAPHRLTVNEYGQDWLVCKVISIDHSTLADEWSISPEAWTGKKSFIAHFPHARMSWFGDDSDVQFLKDKITTAGEYDKLPRISSTPTIGRHGAGDKLRFVLPAGVMDQSGDWMKDPDIVLAIDAKSSLSGRLPIKRHPVETVEILSLARKFFEEMPSMHEGEAISIITSWCMSSFFRPVLIEQLGGHPVLNIHASPGAGKTSLFSRVFWKIFSGVRKGDALSCTSSPFVFAKDLSSVNAMMLVFDEFKVGDISITDLHRFTRILRRNYSGETEGRGRSDQGINSYMLSAPVAVLGESRLDGDQALIERCCFVKLDGMWIRTHQENKKRWDHFKMEAWETVAPWLQAWSLRADVDAMISEAKTATRAALEPLSHLTIVERVLVMLTTIAFGNVAIERVRTALGMSALSVDLTKLFRRLLGESLGDEFLSKGSRPRTHFDEFVSDASTMANTGKLDHGKHYCISNGKLYLWVGGIEPARNEWRRTSNMPNVSPGGRAFVAQANELATQEGSYITNVSVRIRLGSQIRCVEIDQSKIPTSLGINPFPDKLDRDVDEINKSEPMRWRTSAHIAAGDEN